MRRWQDTGLGHLLPLPGLRGTRVDVAGHGQVGEADRLATPTVLSPSPLGGLLQLAAEVNVSSRVALGMSPRGTPMLILKRCTMLLGHISLVSG